MEKKSFKDRWKDKRYQAKVKLSLYGIFILFVVVIVLVGESNTNSNEVVDKEYFDYDNIDNFTYVINVDNDVIRYDIKKDIIYKEYNGVIDTYKLDGNKYYKKINDNYVLTDISYVFDKLSYDYMDINIINNYLLYSESKDNKYIVYLKDILLDSNSEEYIEFDIRDNVIVIDYTNLYNYLSDKKIGKLVVTIEYY